MNHNSPQDLPQIHIRSTTHQDQERPEEQKGILWYDLYLDPPNCLCGQYTLIAISDKYFIQLVTNTRTLHTSSEQCQL